MFMSEMKLMQNECFVLCILFNLLIVILVACVRMAPILTSFQVEYNLFVI